MFTSTYKPKLKVKLKNTLTNEEIVVDIHNEEEIDGKKFWIVQRNNRVLKLSKDAFTLVKK